MEGHGEGIDRLVSLVGERLEERVVLRDKSLCVSASLYGHPRPSWDCQPASMARRDCLTCPTHPIPPSILVGG